MRASPRPGGRRELLESRAPGLEIGPLYVPAVVEEDLDLAVAFEPGDGIDVMRRVIGPPPCAAFEDRRGRLNGRTSGRIDDRIDDRSMPGSSFASRIEARAERNFAPWSMTGREAHAAPQGMFPSIHRSPQRFGSPAHADHPWARNSLGIEEDLGRPLDILDRELLGLRVVAVAIVTAEFVGQRPTPWRSLPSRMAVTAR